MFCIPRIPASLPGLAALVVTGAALAPQAAAQAPATGAVIVGTVDLLEIDDLSDVWSGGRMVVSGQVIILPRNLLIDLPANRLTLQQLFADAPPESVAVGESGLATLDSSRGIGAIATILGNRTSFGNVIAGDVFIEKGTENVQGTVTYIDHTDGYLRVDGNVGDDTTGLMVRINDPDGRYTIQQGKGCDGGPNCSPDVRFGVDPDNYTIVFSTGYPAGIPSTVPVGDRSGFSPGLGDSAGAASDANGVGDPFCPASNRGLNPVADSTRFAPIQVGDAISASGNFEEIAGEFFLSCHSLTGCDSLTTRDDPTQPDYIIWDEVEWDVPAFDNNRVRMLMIGFSTLPSSQVDVFALYVDPDTNENNEFVIASTVNNPDTVNQGIGLGAAGIFKINYDVDFLVDLDERRAPCTNLSIAGLPVPCSSPLGTIAENFRIISPISRELIGRTRRNPPLNPGVITRDINGEEAPNGEYLTPVGIGHPEFVEIDLARLQTPFSFDGIPWLLDRRLSPNGCDGPCENSPQPLDPFPFSGRNPAALAPVASEIFAFFPFGPTDFVAPAVAPGAFPIVPTPRPTLGGSAAPAAPVASFSSSNSSGNAPLVVSFTNESTGAVGAVLWDFGDGSFSIDENPVHVFQAGTFDVTLVALGPGGTDSVTAPGAVVASDPGGGGPEAPGAAFTLSPTAGNIPLTVNFTDLSVGEVTSWSWNFGDGSSSNQQNPSHTYTVAGSYTVSLMVTGPGGSDTAVQPNAVSVNEPGGLDVDFLAIDPTTGPAPLRVRFRAFNITGQATSGVFDFGDGTTGNVGANNGRIIHTYQSPGTYTVTLTATDGTNVDVEQKVDFVTVTVPLINSPDQVRVR